MTPSARIQAVIELLTEIMETARPADMLASAYFRNRRFIGSKDRQAVSGRLYRTIREYHRLSWWILRSGCEVTARTLVIAALIFDKEHSAETIEDAFSGEKYMPEVLTPEEKTLPAKLQGRPLNLPEMPLREKTECPEWAFSMLQKSLGNDFEAEMRAMHEAAPLDLRVNTIKAKRDDALAELKRDGFDAHAGKTSPFSIRVFGRPQITQHRLFKEGCIDIQDEGSQMVAIVAGAKPGEQVLDYCAGGGGKTLAIGAMMENKGRIVALDVQSSRLMSAKERFRRAGLHNIEARTMAEAGEDFIKIHIEYFDLVLLDVPCTGTGIWRRDPASRWRQLGPSFEELVTVQQGLLNDTHTMVKPSGGRLVYATCSLLAEENELQVEKFLAANKNFSLQKTLRLTPSVNDTDGFFAAVLVRST
jgi:16S rRNA (cytosine967-C5)-methyltransferase